MADLTSVRADILAALDNADAALGAQTTSQIVAALNTQVSTLTTELAASNAATTTAVAATAAVQARINAAKVDLG